MNQATVAVLHPGEMGASIGAAARAGGSRVLWLPHGRSDATSSRAAAAGLEAAASLAELLARSAVVFSVCPPHAAAEVAAQVAAQRYRGVFVDANAVSPATARRVADTLAGAGARYVDGGIIGPPPRTAATTRLYLSGDDAARVAELFAGTTLEARTLAGPAHSASALKVCYAAWNKGQIALLANVRALARHDRVEEALLQEWAVSQPGLADRSESSVCKSAFKAWRWVAEMHEIAASFEAAGLPDGFHQGAAEVYRRLEAFKDRAPAPALEEVTATLLGRD